MLLVSFSQVSKDFAGNPVFAGLDFEVIDGERIGLVGENGSGKSTLFKLILGQEDPTKGHISRKRNLTMGYMHQETDPSTLQKTLLEAVSETLPELSELRDRMQVLEGQMSDPVVSADARSLSQVLETYSRAQERFEALGGYEVGHQAEEVLGGLGFLEQEFHQQVNVLSGGEKKLVNLARILVRKPDLLLLDEPDNHLDLRAKAWLEGYIQNYAGSVIIISHDRYLLDRAVKRIVALEDGQISTYPGNYSFYVEERQKRLFKQQETYATQQGEIKRLKESMHRLKTWAKLNSDFASKAAYMERRYEQAKAEAVARPVLERDKMHLTLEGERSGKKVIEVKQLSTKIGDRTLFNPFDLTVLYGECVGIIGANGVGKTTLMKTILDLLPASMGTVKIGASVVVGYYSQEQETLPMESTPIDFVRRIKEINEPKAIALLAKLLFTYEDMHNKIKNLSGGEKSRLQLVRLMLTEANLLLLDEPTNNLDIASVEVLEEALENFEGTILAVSHDRYFLEKMTNRIVALDTDSQVRVYPGNYTYYREKCPEEFALI